MSPYTILVEFTLHDGALPRFLDLIRENAAASLAQEKGCERFDVLVPEGERQRVILYEIYADDNAFAEHCRQPHYHAFDQAAASLVQSKRVTVLDRKSNAASASAASVTSTSTTPSAGQGTTGSGPRSAD
jgi:quinol monooxygenase YgiN